MKTISAQELKNKLQANDEVSLIDIRENYEFEDGNIAGSINIPMDDLAQNPNQIKENTILICRSGRRTESLCYVLERNNNALDLTFLEGGIIAYNENN